MATPATTSAAKSKAKPPVVQPGGGKNIIVNPCQRGNPLLECVKNVGKEFGDIVVDYQVGKTTGVLYLSLKYHRLHPEYIHQRIEKLGISYNLRILLLVCDVSEHQDPIRELTKICLINNITIVVAWNMEEAGFYLSTFKQFEHKPPDLIKERVDKDYHSMLRTVLTSVSKVNKTDVEILRTSFGSFANIARSTSEQLLQLPGFGQVKARRIRDAFEKPFRNNATSALSFQQPILAQGKGQSTNGATSIRREAEMGPLASIHESPPSRTTRDPSPIWDIELDLNSSPPLEEPAARQFTPGPSNPKKRPPSPVWDIELDLNEESEDHTIHKRHRGDAEEFDPTSLLQ